jgi:hypothetical protein
MATLATTHPTMADVATRLDPNGRVAAVLEILNEQNEMLEDMVWIEANDGTSHVSTARTGLPAPTWRKIYGGVQPTKSTTAQVRDNTGDLQAYAEVDARLVELNGNAPAFRASEDAAHLEGMNQELSETIWYGNEGTEPEAFHGLAPRFNSLSAENASNIINGGGAGSDNHSVWLVGWGPNTVHGIYPKGLPTGFQMDDKDRVTVENVDGNNGRAEMYRTHYSWAVGLAVPDWRYVVRIANIDHSALTADAASGANLIDLMVQAIEMLPSLNNVRPAFYVNRTIRSFLRRQVMNHANVNLTLDTVAGKRMLAFDEIPVRRSDQLLNGTEATIS